MRLLIILATLVTALAARSESYFGPDNKQITKLQAMRVLIENSNATILRCNEVMLTDKATLKNKPLVKPKRAPRDAKLTLTVPRPAQQSRRATGSITPVSSLNVIRGLTRWSGT